MIPPLWRTVWRFLKKLGIKLPYDPTIPLLGIFLEETIIEKDTCTPVFIAALFTVARTWKQEAVIHMANTHMKICSILSVLEKYKSRFL